MILIVNIKDIFIGFVRVSEKTAGSWKLFMVGDNGELAVNSPIKPDKLSRMIHRITVGKNVAKN